jgi:hypothetical protein
MTTDTGARNNASSFVYERLGHEYEMCGLPGRFMHSHRGSAVRESLERLFCIEPWEARSGTRGARRS